MIVRLIPAAAVLTLALGVPRAAAAQEFQVPAGTALFIELRTAIASDTSKPLEPIRAVLASAVVIDGVELVPAGATIHGTITDVDAAFRKTDVSRLAFRFHVLEHPQTGSRVPIKTEVRAYAVDAGKKKKDAVGTAAFNQVTLPIGSAVTISLREPFLVRIPTSR
jgi:hypothetical protein